MGVSLRPGAKISPDTVIRRCEEAVEAARVYFGLSNEWRVWIVPGDGKGGAAAALIKHPYLKVEVNVDVEYLMLNPEELWGTMGHEVAHLVTAELNHLWGKMPDQWSDDGHTECDLLRDAFEQATVRLERMFVRDCPDPHAAPHGGAQ